MIRFLVNPSAGNGRGRRALERLGELASRHGAELRTSRDAEDLEGQSRAAAAEGVERLVVAGGDGTFHHAIQGLAGSPCALGMVPLGRGNDLASALDVPQDLGRAVERAVTGPVRRIDLGRAGDRVFAVYCGVGFDSEVAGYVRSGKGLLRGPLAYPWGVVRVLAGFQPPELRVEHESGSFAGRAMFAVAANGPRFGGGMYIAPQARLDDGLLELVIVREVSRLALLRVFPRVYRGTHVGHPAISFVRCRRASIALDRPMTMFGDGEPLLEVGEEPVEIEVWERALAVVA